jgi:hypothetical protein
VNTHRKPIALHIESVAKCSLRLFVQPAEEHAKVEQIRIENGGIGFALDRLDEIWRVHNIDSLERHAQSVDR